MTCSIHVFLLQAKLNGRSVATQRFYDSTVVLYLCTYLVVSKACKAVTWECQRPLVEKKPMPFGNNLLFLREQWQIICFLPILFVLLGKELPVYIFKATLNHDRYRSKLLRRGRDVRMRGCGTRHAPILSNLQESWSKVNHASR